MPHQNASRPATDRVNGPRNYDQFGGSIKSASTSTNSQIQAERWAAAPDDIEAATFASLIRVLEQAPIENKLAVFSLIGREAAACADIRRRQFYDDCLWLADETGLTELVGIVTVTDALMTAFNGRAE